MSSGLRGHVPGARWVLVGFGLAAGVWVGWHFAPPRDVQAQHALPLEDKPYVMASSEVEAGRYLIKIAGCNDCHTSGYLMTGGQVPEENWMLGDSIGWRGPWGTTYPTNLRLKVQEYDDAETFVQVYKARNDRPPMPWMSLHDMSERDLKAIYHYLKHVGPAGEVMPEWVPPTEEPKTPYLSLFPQFPPGMMPPEAQ
jgi:mono/diheme cytochrome c family protein